VNKFVIIADDLTGANATGVLLARNGYKTGTFLSLDTISPEQFSIYDVISISTDSRAIPAQEAYDRVKNAAESMSSMNISMFSKRIDSTLRGNIGAEIDAILDVLGPETMAIVVAAFPSSGRVTVGGYLMVDSIPLEKTFVAKDPKTPVEISRVSEIVTKQTKYKVGHITLDIVLESTESVVQAFFAHKEAGKRIVVFDAATQEDIEKIAQAVRLSGIHTVAVDPGPFTEAMARNFLRQPESHPGRKVLLVVGSVTPLARQQLKDVELNYDACFVHADAEALIEESSAGAEIQNVVQLVLKKINDYQILGIRTIKEEGDILNIEEIAEKRGMHVDDVAEKISNGLAQITKEILDRSTGVLGALYTSGGDTTVAVCRELQAVGVEVKDEVIPLAAYGRIIGGKYNNIPLITKGGLVGGDDAISICIEYLLTKISNEYSPSI
jgi:uncharacterized protein YgbK (DUF1537 family)